MEEDKSIRGLLTQAYHNSVGMTEDQYHSRVKTLSDEIRARGNEFRPLKRRFHEYLTQHPKNEDGIGNAWNKAIEDFS